MRNSYYDTPEFKDILKRYETALAEGRSCYLDTDDFVDLSDYFLDKDDAHQALFVVEAGLALHPDDTLLMVVKAGVLIFLHRFGEARELVDTLSERDNFDVVYLQAQLAYAMDGKPDEANRLFERWIEFVEEENGRFNDNEDDNDNENDNEDEDENGNVYRDMYDDEEDDEDGRDPGEAENDVRSAYVHVMTSYMDLSTQPHEKWVREWAEKYVKRFKEFGDFESDYMLADIVREENQLDLVAEVYERLLEKDPYMYMGWTMLAAAKLSMGEFDESVSAADFALAIDPDDRNALGTKAQACYALGRYEDALEMFLKIRNEEGDAAEDEYIAFCYCNLNRIEEALTYLRSAAEYVLNDDEMGDEQLAAALNEIADGFAACNRPDEALPLARRITKMFPDNQHYLLLKASLLLGAGDIHAALKGFSQLLRSSENVPVTMVEIASRMMAYNYTEPAIELLETALNQDVPDEEFYNRYQGCAYLAYGYRQIGQKELCRYYLDLAKEHEPEMVNNLFEDN